MALRKLKQILLIFVAVWLAALIYYFVVTHHSKSIGFETIRLERAKRVLDKSQMTISALQHEVKSLRAKIVNYKRKFKKVYPQISKSLPNSLDTGSVGDNSRKDNKLKHLDKTTIETNDANKKQQLSNIKYAQKSNDLELEITRRRAMKEYREMWYYLSAEVTKINKLLGRNIKQRLTAMLDKFADIHRALGNNLDFINNHKTLDIWRRNEQTRMSKIVQNRLRLLQNPSDCENADKLICNLNKECGYGCQIHHLLYCFITAYGAKRTLIVKSNGWRYSPRGWERVFLPVSDTCTEAKGPISTWSMYSEEKNVYLPIIDSIDHNLKHLPLAVPSDLAKSIQAFHGFPFVWWVGQFAKYLFRYQPAVKKNIENKKAMLGFAKPIVGYVLGFEQIIELQEISS